MLACIATTSPLPLVVSSDSIASKSILYSWIKTTFKLWALDTMLLMVMPISAALGVIVVGGAFITIEVDVSTSLKFVCPLQTLYP